jgi:crotonobetainyl-CoA:carnitine CoA-transferase CaiB-like acyl-CoA transferase
MWRLQRAGVAAMPSMSAQDLSRDPHLRERQAFPELSDPRHGRRRVVGPPWRFSHTPAGIHKWSPALGEDNESVLSELLGLSPADLSDLKAEGTVS